MSSPSLPFDHPIDPPESCACRRLATSAGLHLLLVVLGMLVLPDGCIRPYRLPAGAGDAPPVSRPVTVQQEKQRIILVDESPIVLRAADIPDSAALQAVRTESEQIYQASMAGAGSGIGEGGSDAGYNGWPDGEIRFIRLRHHGRGWADGYGDADRNFLHRLRQLGGGALQVAASGEAHPIAALARYPAGQAPPFVFLTGEGDCPIGRTEREILRTYLHDGGMLFIDCGSRAFFQSIAALIPGLLAGKSLVKVPDDDVLLCAPHTFPDGIDPLWGHGGSQLLGCKIRGRWAVVLHPGDINDCWKDAAAILPQPVRNRAFELGQNIVHYACRSYAQRYPAEQR